MYSAKRYWFYVLLTVAMAILGYWMFVATLAPMPAAFEEASGRVSSAKANSRKGSIHTIYFSIEGNSRRFAYPGIFPGITEVWASLQIGAEVEVEYQDKDPGSDAVDLWGLTVNGRNLITPEESYRARRKNGYWGLVLGVAFTFSAAYLWLRRKKHITK